MKLIYYVMHMTYIGVCIKLYISVYRLLYITVYLLYNIMLFYSALHTNVINFLRD